MNRTHFRITAAVAAGLGLAAANSPALLAHVSGGLWEVSSSATGADPVRLCVSDALRLAQYEHRSARCSRRVIDSRGDEALINYSCAGSGFGNTRITMLTPRSLRLDTQGIKDGQPFGYVLHARLIGDCHSR